MFTTIDFRYSVDVTTEVNSERTIFSRGNSYRYEIDQFCRGVLTRQNEQICELIDSQGLAWMSRLDIAGMNLTRDTFGDSFSVVCEKLFEMRRPRTAYIIAILAYALKLDEYCTLHCTWYSIELLIYTLTDIFVNVGLDLDVLSTTHRRCTLL